MGLSINPASLLDVFIKRGYRNRDHVADFLDEVAEQAQTLAKIWDRVIDDLSGETGKFKPDANALEILRRYDTDNAGPFSQLQEFYRCFSATMEGKLNEEWHRNIIGHLGALLRKRDLTLETYQRVVSGISKSSFVDNENSLEDFKDLSRLSIALHKEVAALVVLAHSFRVRQG